MCIRRLLPLLLIAASACGDGAERPVAVVRDTLANGALRLRYLALDSVPATVEADLRLGTVEGDPNLVFGDLRSVEADRAGTIYVLDAQAVEVRAFDASGRFLRTVAKGGEGPGEISASNGMQLVGDTTLWVEDHGKWMMLGLSPAGGEMARVPMPVLSYGYTWDGVVDDRGRFWQPASHDDAPLQLMPPEGLNEGTVREYFKFHDPVSETSDSIYLGDRAWRSWVIYRGSGRRFYQVPFDPTTISTIDPAGGIWRASTGAYRIVRLDESGDTTLVIEAPIEPRPVTQADRDRWLETVRERGDPLRTLEQIIATAGATHPVIADLTVDDRGRLWVQRNVSQDQPVIYDIFERDGTYAGSISPSFRPTPYIPIRIRGDRMYAVVRDSMDVPYVVRAPLPVPAR